MITEKELMEAIWQCEREPITQSKVSKLADFYIVYDHLFGKPETSAYSYANKVENIIDINGDTEFLATVNGKDIEKVMKILDELMEATKTLHPRMYDRVLQKIEDI